MRANQAGLSDELDWTVCSIGDHQPTRCGLEAAIGDFWLIAAYNPSTVDQSILSLSAPSDSAFIVSTIGEDQTWTQVPSDVMCFTAVEDTESADQFNACDLFVKLDVPA